MKKQNSNLIKVVNVLRDGKYHDGTTIGDALQMTRSAVWKTIKKLQSYGIPIESIKGKGYALQTPLILLQENNLRQHLVNDNIDIAIFESLNSTNDYFKALKTPTKKISICLAEQQTQGRGRFDREWHSPFGQNIYLSCLYTFQKDISELAGLSLVTSLAIVKTLNSYSDKDHFSVKWPNDVIYATKKISGSLIEIQAESHGLCHATIGIGVNVNMMSDAGDISQAWTSLQKVVGHYIDRNELCARLINNLLAYLDEFAAHGLSLFRDEWAKADYLTNKTITLHHVKDKIQGTVQGINDHGHLILQLADNTTRAFSSGDTSLNKRHS